MLLEAVAIQDAWNRVFLFIQYLYLSETLPEPRKRAKKRADLCEAKAGEPLRISLISVRCYCKNLEIFMACIFFSISNRKLEIVKVLN